MLVTVQRGPNSVWENKLWPAAAGEVQPIAVVAFIVLKIARLQVECKNKSNDFKKSTVFLDRHGFFC